jgi:hypothetical protein
MPNAGSLTTDSRFCALFVGPKHSGKTVAACSFIKDNPDPLKDKIKVLDFDGRIRGILGAPWIDRKMIDYEYYPPRLGIKTATVYEKLNSDLETMLLQYQVGQSVYNTIIGDSLTAECFALMCDAVPMTHKTEQGKDKGKRIGTMNMPGPEDYGFEAAGTYSFLAFLRSFPAQNVIVTAHIVDKFGKLNPDDKYSESVVVGEKLSIRDKIGTNIGIYFDHIFRFERRMIGYEEHFFVRFISSIACTSFQGMPTEEIDITGKNFYKTMLEYAAKGQTK